MHTPTIVTQVMQCCSPLMHAARWCALRDVVVSSVNGHALGLNQRGQARILLLWWLMPRYLPPRIHIDGVPSTSFCGP